MKSQTFLVDNMEGMSWYPDHFFSLGISDPPYGIDGNSHRKNSGRGKLAVSRNYHNALWDQGIPTDAFFAELKRVSVNQIIFGANYFPQISGTPFKTPRRKEWPQFIEDNPTNWIIWDKCNGTNSFNDCELIYTTFNRPTSIFKFMWNGMMQGKSIFEGHLMQPIKELNQNRIHPTEKPTRLYKFLFMEFVQSGSKVLDTHLGSGSSRIAAHEMNLPFVGMETDLTYFTDQENRFKTIQRQLSFPFL